MKPRFIVRDDLIAWYGRRPGRQLLGLSIFTLTVDTFNPAIAGKNFRNWLICSQTASGVESELIATGPPGHFDPLQNDYWPWFAEGNLISCPKWSYSGSGTATESPTDLGLLESAPPSLGEIIDRLGLTCLPIP